MFLNLYEYFHLGQQMFQRLLEDLKPWFILIFIITLTIWWRFYFPLMYSYFKEHPTFRVLKCNASSTHFFQCFQIFFCFPWSKAPSLNMDVLEPLECLYLLTQFLASIQNKKQFIFNEFFSDAWSGKDSHGERLQNGWVLEKPKAGRINVCKSVFPREWSKENSFKSSNTPTFLTLQTRLLLAQRRVDCKWIYLLWICYISELFICIIFADYIWECQFYILGMTATPKIPVRRIWIMGWSVQFRDEDGPQEEFERP